MRDRANTTIRELLASSRAAHQRYRLQHAGRIDKHGKVSHHTQLRAAGAAIQDALSFRLEAEELDPPHSDLAWVEDAAANKGQTSATMVAFLSRYLTPIEARVSNESNAPS